MNKQSTNITRCGQLSYTTSLNVPILYIEKMLDSLGKSEQIKISLNFVSLPNRLVCLDMGSVNALLWHHYTYSCKNGTNIKSIICLVYAWHVNKHVIDVLYYGSSS